MTVSPAQIIAAQAKGLVNVVPLARACDKFKVPFYLAATIMERETGGANIFGHDAGGSFSGPITVRIEVTEGRYKKFLAEIGAGKASNGVGPMQLTYRGYHIGPVSMQARGFKAWVPADNILYGVEILSKSLKTQLAAGLTIEKAFWNVAKIYNAGKLEGPAGTDYANGAAASARTWAATVGSSDMEDRMGTLASNIAQLAKPAGLTIAIRQAAAEVLTAAEEAGHHVAAVSWFNPASTPEHHVPGFPNQGGVAVDFMVYGDQKVQDFVDGYMWANRARLGICWIISRRRIRSTSPGHSGNWTAYNEPDPHTTHTHTNFGHLAGTNGYVKVAKISYQPPEDDMPTAKEIVDELIKRGPEVGAAIAKGYLSADDIIPSGKDEPSTTNKFQTPKTFVKSDHDLLVDIREALQTPAPPKA